MIWVYNIAIILPSERLRTWAVDRLVESGHSGATPSLLRILSSDPYFTSPQFSHLVGALAKGHLRDRSLADKLLEMYKQRAEKSSDRVSKYAFFGMDKLAMAIFTTGGEAIVPIIAAMVTDRNPSIRELAFKVFEQSQRAEGLKPLLTVAGSILSNREWDDDAFNAIQAIAKKNGVAVLRTALESLMKELDARTFCGCMDVAGRLLQWLPMSTDILELAGNLPLDEVHSTYANALKDQDMAIRIRAADLLLGRLSQSGEDLAILEQIKNGDIPTKDDVNHIDQTISRSRNGADTMLGKEYRRKNTLLKDLPWHHVLGDKAQQLFKQGGLTFSGGNKSTCVALIAPIGMVVLGEDVDCTGWLNGISFRQICSNGISLGSSVEASGHRYHISTGQSSTYINGERTTMVALIFSPADGAEAPEVKIDKVTVKWK